MVTASIRRISLEGYAESLSILLGGQYPLLPNTAGCVTVRDAVLTAQLAREALDTNWVKLELIGDRETLYPDVEQLAARDGRARAKRLYRAALLQRRSRHLPKARRCRLRRGHAAGLADRLRAWVSSIPQRSSGSARRSPVPVDARCRHRHRLRCGAGDGAGLRRGDAQHRDRQGARSRAHGVGDARRCRRRPPARLAGRIPKRVSPSRRARNLVSSAPDGAAQLVCPTKPGPTFSG